MKNEITYLLKERLEFSSPLRWKYDVVGTTHDISEACAWTASSPWRVFDVDESKFETIQEKNNERDTTDPQV